MSLSFYGTPFEELDDDEKSIISKKPKPVHEEVVTDERGRRRFHGAFTGGFSAGYFNTAGSKHGWVPQTFKSSRTKRAEQSQATAEDFMDEEDLGEFGIAPQSIHTKRDFMDSIATPGEKRLLAWERAPTAASTSGGDMSAKLEEIVKPIQNDSIGIRLLKKMGWRAGKGIGPTLSRRALERQKVNDAKTRGHDAVFDENAVKDIESVAPNAEFAPDDVPNQFYNPKENNHGLGYQPLGDSSVLRQNFGEVASALKKQGKGPAKGKGIRGQAFGVGVYEDDDEDIYTNVDLTQYDYEIGAGTSTVKETPQYESAFVPAKQLPAQRRYYDAPKPPHGFKPFHKPIPMNVSHLPLKLMEATKNLTPFQRAMFLGDRSVSIMQLLSEQDRQKLLKIQEARQGKTQPRKQMPTSAEIMPFEEEPMKAHRFKQYVQYLKRGLTLPQPIDLTRLEWDQELVEFQRHLTPELRAMLPEVRSRQLPLAKMDLAGPLAEQLKSRFQNETNDEANTKPLITKDHDRIQAVRLKMFGDKTRTKYEWHPAKDLCKRFNVPNPFPDSSLIGVLELQKRTKTETLLNLGLPNTYDEMQLRHGQKTRDDRDSVQILEKENIKEEAESTYRPPQELLQALFNESDDSDAESTTSDVEEEANVRTAQEVNLPGPSALPPTAMINERSPQDNKVISVIDLVQDDDDEYGPRLPPMSMGVQHAYHHKPVPLEVTVSDSSSENEEESVKRKKKHKKSKSHKHGKSRKKEKKDKRREDR